MVMGWNRLCFSRHAVSVPRMPADTTAPPDGPREALESCSCSWQMVAAQQHGTSRGGRLVPRIGSKQAHYDAFWWRVQNRSKSLHKDGW